jgi:hypothetical protein
MLLVIIFVIKITKMIIYTSEDLKWDALKGCYFKSLLESDP